MLFGTRLQCFGVHESSFRCNGCVWFFEASRLWMGSRGGLAFRVPSMLSYEATDPGTNPRHSDFFRVDSKGSESHDGCSSAIDN